MKLHPDIVTLFFWLFASAMFYFSHNLTGYLFWVSYICVACLFLVELAWSLKVKQRSLFILFFLLIPFLGFFIVWFMDSATPKGSNN